MMSGVQGGNFWNGFASGALSSIAASAWSGGTNHDGLGASGKQMTHYGGYEGIGNFLGAEGGWHDSLWNNSWWRRCCLDRW